MRSTTKLQAQCSLVVWLDKACSSARCQGYLLECVRPTRHWQGNIACNADVLCHWHHALGTACYAVLP